MDSDEESFGKSDSGHNSPTDDEDDFPMEMDQPPVKEKAMETDEYPYETLTTESIVQTMIDCIDDVNSVLNVRFIHSFSHFPTKFLVFFCFFFLAFKLFHFDTISFFLNTVPIASSNF